MLSEAECPHAEDAIIVIIFDWIVGRDTGTAWSWDAFHERQSDYKAREARIRLEVPARHRRRSPPLAPVHVTLSVCLSLSPLPSQEILHK